MSICVIIIIFLCFDRAVICWLVGPSSSVSIALILVYSVGTHSTTHPADGISHHLTHIAPLQLHHEIPWDSGAPGASFCHQSMESHSRLIESYIVEIACWTVGYSFTAAVGARLQALETQNLNTRSAGTFLSTAAYRIQDHFLTNFPDGHTIAPVFVLSCNESPIW